MQERKSNFELLRIVAMILVLIIHVFLLLPRPTEVYVVKNPFKALEFYVVDAIAISCVNIFILISGWFGMKVNWKKFRALIFQVLFFSILIWSALVTLFPNKYLNGKSLSTILMLNSCDYWFIKSYIGLYLLSPIINKFIENSTQKEYGRVLLALFIFQTIYGWFSINGAEWIGGGYSAFSFVCLYSLGRYVRLYQNTIILKKGCTLAAISIKPLSFVFLGIVMILALTAFSVTYVGLPIEGRLFTYTNPLVILEAIILLLIFSRLKIKSSVINGMASSCLAIYLLHGNELVLRPFYGTWIAQWYQNDSTFIFLSKTVLFIIVVFAVAITLDKIRSLFSKLIFG